MDMLNENIIERGSTNWPLCFLFIPMQVPLSILFIALLGSLNEFEADEDLLAVLSSDLESISMPLDKAANISEYIDHYPLVNNGKKTLVIIKGKLKGKEKFWVSNYQWHLPSRNRPQSVALADIVLLIQPGSFVHQSAKWIRTRSDGSQEEIGNVSLPKWDIYIWEKSSNTVLRKAFLGYLARRDVIVYNVTNRNKPDFNIGSLPFEKIEKFFSLNVNTDARFDFPKVERKAWELTNELFQYVKG